METIRVSTIVYAQQETVYDFLLDFKSYPQYSEHVKSVSQNGDGSESTVYGIELGWWKLTYTGWSSVDTLNKPTSIQWSMEKDVDAHGSWTIKDVTADHGSQEHATKIVLEAQFDTNSIDTGVLNLPMFVNFNWVIDKVEPLVYKEARKVLKNVVTELEGTPRVPHLEVHTTPSKIDESDIDSVSGPSK